MNPIHQEVMTRWRAEAQKELGFDPVSFHPLRLFHRSRVYRNFWLVYHFPQLVDLYVNRSDYLFAFLFFALPILVIFGLGMVCSALLFKR